MSKTYTFLAIINNCYYPAVSAPTRINHIGLSKLVSGTSMINAVKVGWEPGGNAEAPFP